MSDIIERLLQCQSILDLMCHDHRPLKMSIPVQTDDEDVLLSNAIGDAMKVITTQQRALDAARARIKELVDWSTWAWQYIQLVHGPRWEEGQQLVAALSAKGGSDGAHVS